ncbi:hypothetical protein ACE6H2_014253 [Prunus campanulata]
MKPYAITLMAFGAAVAAAAVICLCFVCIGGIKKKQMTRRSSTVMQSVTPPPAQLGHRDVEGGEAVHRQSRTNGTKDGGMVILNKNKNKNKNTVVPPSGQPANRGEVERGGVTNQSSSRTKDGGMVILAGRVALATTAVVIN